jgi:dipeptidyl aminopeptidase/acylaminoacyl peptidase
VRAEDLPLIAALSTPTVHPDGDRAVVSAVRADFAGDAYVGQLWNIALDRSGPCRITRGFRDTKPAYSPDGKLLGFLRAFADKPPQVAIVSANGGEPMLITDAKMGVRSFRFSPDSAQIAFLAAVPQEGRCGTIEGVDAAHEDPRLIDNLQFHENGIGYLADQRPQVFVVAVPDPFGEPPVLPVGRAVREGVQPELVPVARQLTAGDFNHHSLAWVGDSVVVISARHSGRDRDLRADLYLIGAQGAPLALTDSASGVSALASPVVVGDHIYFVGIETGVSGVDVAGVNAGVYVVPVSGGRPQRLTDAETVCIEGSLAETSRGVLAIDQVRGSGVAIEVDASGELRRWVMPGSVLAVGAGGGVGVAVVATASSPGELVVLESDGQPLTNFAAPLGAAIVPVEHSATAPDGYPVHGWTLSPLGAGPHPVVLLIHGGPFSAYSGTFFDEAQVLAGAGFAVVMCNPRGSAGYGQAHGRVLKAALGDRDVVDVLAFLDHCLAVVPELDPARVAVAGGSYGGYLAAWLISQTHRFAAAVVERGYLDGRSMIGASDIGWFFPFEYQGDLAAIDARSPLYLVHQVQTPTLVIHSDNDLRCPLGVAQRYYTELKLRGVEAEFLVFPGENHELSRSGTPQHRLARFTHIVAWLNRHLR